MYWVFIKYPVFKNTDYVEEPSSGHTCITLSLFEHTFKTFKLNHINFFVIIIKPGVYIKFEIHIFAPFLIHIFSSYGIYYYEGGALRMRTFSAFFLQFCQFGKNMHTLNN